MSIRLFPDVYSALFWQKYAERINTKGFKENLKIIEEQTLKQGRQFYKEGYVKASADTLAKQTLMALNKSVFSVYFYTNSENKFRFFSTDSAEKLYDMLWYKGYRYTNQPYIMYMDRIYKNKTIDTLGLTHERKNVADPHPNDLFYVRYIKEKVSNKIIDYDALTRDGLSIFNKVDENSGKYVVNVGLIKTVAIQFRTDGLTRELFTDPLNGIFKDAKLTKYKGVPTKNKVRVRRLYKFIITDTEKIASDDFCLIIYNEDALINMPNELIPLSEGKTKIPLEDIQEPFIEEEELRKIKEMGGFSKVLKQLALGDSYVEYKTPIYKKQLENIKKTERYNRKKENIENDIKIRAKIESKTYTVKLREFLDETILFNKEKYGKNYRPNEDIQIMKELLKDTENPLFGQLKEIIPPIKVSPPTKKSQLHQIGTSSPKLPRKNVLTNNVPEEETTTYKDLEADAYVYKITIVAELEKYNLFDENSPQTKVYNYLNKAFIDKDKREKEQEDMDPQLIKTNVMERVEAFKKRLNITLDMKGKGDLKIATLSKAYSTYRAIYEPYITEKEKNIIDQLNLFYYEQGK